MSLFTQRTQLDQDLAFKDSLILRGLEAAHHMAVTLEMSYREFWELPTDRLEAILNADIPRTLAMFAGNTELGTAVNSALDTAKYGTVRSPVELPPNVSFDGKKFTVTTSENVQPQ